MVADFIKSIILGIIEGLTEFIPISSTGHLILAGDYLKLSSANVDTFNISIQLGAILAVVVLYRDFFIDTFSPKNWFKKNMNNIIIAIIPAIIMGYSLHSFIKKNLFSTKTVILALLIGGLIMLFVEKVLKIKAEVTSIENIKYHQAFLIGVCQCFALWPGMSRSGSTIVGGLIAKLDHQTSAKFSFIIGVPIMVLAVAYEMLSSFKNLTSSDFIYIGIGFVVSFLFGLLAIKTFLEILKRFKLFPFALYRIILSILVLSII
jgi:undecaprenyl-diphosphatase